MSITIKLKRGTSASCNSYTGSAGELVYDTTNNILRLHNGTKTGGYQLWNSDTIDGRYLKLSGGTLNGGLLVGPNGSDSEGGQIGLKPGTDSDYGIWVDTTAGNFRVFGMTNPGSVFVINPQTDVISYNGKHLVRSINNTTADSTGNVTLSLNYLPLTGGRMTGALNYANDTWNLLGDDVYFGDHNIGGGFCLKGANNTTKLVFYKQDESA